MNSTPNYNFKDNIKLCAVDAIDRELRRVENKVDTNTVSILDRYTKAEVDCLLRKRGGDTSCNCACDAQLDRIWKALRERYSNEEIDELILRYICEHDRDSDTHPRIWEELQRLGEELSNKANTGPEKLTWTMLPLEGEFINYSLEYARSSTGMIFLNGLFRKSTTPEAGNTVGFLPEGFRPSKMLSTTVFSNTLMYLACVHINTNGQIAFAQTTPVNSNPDIYLGIDTAFLAAPESY